MTHNIKDQFIAWYFNEFRHDPLCSTMEQTTEASSWHREKNVLVHTDMVVSQCISRTSGPWMTGDLCIALACAFHDVGKPTAEETVHSEERGEYRRYHGHEKISARLWEDYVIRNWSKFTTTFPTLSKFDIYRVGWVIENHLPYGIKNPHKLENLRMTINSLFGADNRGTQLFGRMLNSDCWGRISDDHDDKKANTSLWQDDFARQTADVMFQPADEDRPELTMLIGPSGCGKSSWVASKTPSARLFSWDGLRLEWYSSDYTEAFNMQVNDSQFNQKANAVFVKYIQSGEDVVVDNTNLSAKRRAFFVNTARQHGYRVTGILFPIDVQTCVDRVASRLEQPIPESAIRRQYMSLNLPNYGDFDNIKVEL